MVGGRPQPGLGGGGGGAALPPLLADDLLHRLARGFTAFLLGLGALAAAGLLVAVLLGGARPAWWRDAPAGAGDRRALAGAVDNGAWTAVTQLRPLSVGEPGARVAVSEPWSVSLSAEGATAWLNEKLPRWLATQHHPVRVPDGSEFQAAFEQGVVRLGMRIPDSVSSGGDESGARFVSIALHPRIDGEGLWLPAVSASIGRLDVPVVALFADPPGDLASLLRGRVPALRGAAIELPDGRTVRLLGFEPGGGRLVLTMRTELRR